MELKETLSSTSLAERDLLGLANVTHPKRLLHLVLLLGVSEDLTWVCRGNDVEKFVPVAYFSVRPTYRLLSQSLRCFNILLITILSICVIMLGIFISFKQLGGQCVICLGGRSLVETQRDKSLFEHLSMVVLILLNLLGSQF